MVYTYKLHLWLGYGLSLPIDLSLLMHIQIDGLDLGCLCSKSHDLLILFLHVKGMRFVTRYSHGGELWLTILC